MRSSFAAAFVLVSILACDSILDPSLPVEIRMSASTYVLEDGTASAEFTVRNAGDETLYVQRCGGRIMTFLDRWQDDDWVHYRGDACPAIYLSVPLELGAGEEVEGSRGVHEPGRFRLRVGVSTTRETPDEWTAAREGFTVER